MKGGSGEIFCTWAPWSNESRYQIIVKTVRECYGQTSHAVAEHQVTLWLLQVVCCKVLELKLFGTSPFCELLDWRGGIFFFFFWVLHCTCSVSASPAPHYGPCKAKHTLHCCLSVYSAPTWPGSALFVTLWSSVNVKMSSNKVEQFMDSPLVAWVSSVV